MKKLFPIIAAILLFTAFPDTAYAWQNVAADTLETVSAGARSFVNILEGQISGVNVSATDGGVNSASNIYIRGLNAIHSDSQPLVILDGVILTSSLSQNLVPFYDRLAQGYISPLDSRGYLSAYEVESIEVLKDLSATALYGAKAANGVIIVKTKYPRKEGRAIQWHSNVGVEFPMTKVSSAIPALSHNHTVGISRNNKGTSHSIGAFYRHTGGIFKGTGSSVGGLSVRFDTRTNPYVWFSFNSNTGVTKQTSTGGAAYLGEASHTMVSRYPSDFPDNTLQGWTDDYDDDVMDYRSSNSATLTINALKMLKIEAKVGADFESNQRSIWFGNGTSFGKSLNGAASVLESTLFNYNAILDIVYSRFFGVKNSFKAMAWVDVDGNANKFNTMCGYDFFNHDLRAKGLSIMGSDPKLNKYQRTYSEMGAGLNITYGYAGIFGANASLSLGYNRKYDERPVFYPSGNIYFDLHEAFLKDSKAISALRLEGGYGTAGREYYIPYELTANFYTGAYPSVHPGAETFYDSLNRLYSSEYNAGIRMGFASGRANLNVSYYDKTTQDRFSMFCFGAYSDEAKLWAYTSRQNAFSNVEKLRNRGFEADLTATLVDNSLIRLNIRSGAAYNVNQLIETNGENVKGRNLGDGVFVNANVRGYSVSSLFGYEEDGAGGFKDNFRDGVLDDMDKVVLANAVPTLTGYAGATFCVSGFALDVLTTFSDGSFVADLNSMVHDGVKEFSAKYIRKAGFFKLGRVALSYIVPLKVRWIRDLKVSLSGNNLLTATNYEGYNPDVNCFGSSALSYGVDYGSYPVTGSVMFGVSAKF